MEKVIIYALSHIIEVFLAYYFFHKLFSPAKCKHPIAIYAITYLALFSSMFLKLYSLNIVLYILANFLMARYIYRKSPSTTLFYTIILAVLMAITEFIPALIPHNFYTRYKVEAIADSTVLFTFIVSKTLYLFGVLIFVHYMSKKQNKSSNTTPLYLNFIILLSVLILTALYTILTTQELRATSRYCILATTTLVILINLTALWLQEYIQRKNDELSEIRLTLQQEHNAVNYFNSTKEQAESQSILIHDIKNHIIIIQKLCQDNNLPEASRYLEQLMELPALSRKTNLTSNQNLNIILNVFVTRCEQSHIRFSVDSDGMYIDFMKTSHMTSLFCNLLDNSVEAARKCDTPFISLIIRYEERLDTLKISVINSCRQEPKTDQRMKLISTKHDCDNHGFGLASIERIVNIYNGDMHYFYDKDTSSFHTIIMITKNREEK